MRYSSLLAAAAAAVTCVSGSPVVQTHAVHEKRDIVPHGWERHHNALRKDMLMPMKIGLSQSNLDKAYEYLMDVSHPESANYGKHWTAQQVKETFAPSQESIDAVKAWLKESGIAEERVSHARSGGWLQFDVTVEEAESLLKTNYYLFEHETGQPHVACDDYSVPAHLSKHIDIITPSVHFDAPIKPRTENNEKKKRAIPGIAKQVGKPGTIANSGSAPKLAGYINPSQIISELQNCSNQIVPDCLRALYEFTPNFYSNPKNSFAIVEYTPEAYVPGDLDMFFGKFAPQLVGQRPILDSIDGGVNQQYQMSFDYNGESDLDLQYGMSLVYPQKVTLYQAGDLIEGASFNNLLDALDKSYCTYEGGDDPTQDATYPDPLGYSGPEACGTITPAYVISTSYGYNEADLTSFYEHRQCNEYMKLGLMGVSVVYSSGDYGVAGNGGQCLNPDGSYNNGGSGRFNPSFPGTCPYVTSVGATQVIPGTNIVEALLTNTEPEMASETVIYSGGGFSNNFAMPSYQQSAVQSYFKNHNPPYGADRYNNSRVTRGYPDISANGANYVVSVDNQFALVYGTSCSAPVFGSILTLINEARLTFGKGPVGFINPVLYSHSWALNDITQGGNQGCGTAGFSAVPGWDPVTGLGTPNFPKLLSVFLGL